MNQGVSMMRFSGALIGLAAVALALLSLITPKHLPDNYDPNPKLLGQMAERESAIEALEEKKVEILDHSILGNADAEVHIGGYSEDQVKTLLAAQAASAKQVTDVTQQQVKLLQSQLELAQQMLRDFQDRRQKEQEDEKLDHRFHLMMMTIITFCAISLLWYVLRSGSSVPRWTQEILKVAAGAICAGWFPK